MDKSSSLGMPMSPQELSKKYKRQSLGMPQHPLFINKLSCPLSIRYIFIASYDMCCSWSVFVFVFSFFCFVCCNKWLDPIIHVLEETHSILIAWNTLVFTLIVPRVFQFFQCYVQLLFSLLFMLRACLVFFTFVCLALCTLLKIIYESCFK